MSSLTKWGMVAIAAAALLSPVLAFLLAMALEIVLVVLQDAGLLKFVALVAVVAMGWLMLRKAVGPAARSLGRYFRL